MGASAHRIGALARHRVVLLRRSPGQVVVYTVMACLLTLVVEPMAELLPTAGVAAPPGARAAAGMLVFCSLFMAGVAGAAVVDERVWRTAERLRSTPARPAELLAGTALPLLGLLLVQQVVVLVVASTLYPTGLGPHWPRLLGVGTAWAACVLGIGLLLAAVTTTSAQLSTVKDLTALALSTTGGAVVPLAALPSWLAPAGRFSPAYWAVAGYLGGPAPAGTAVAVLAGVAVVTFATATLLLGRRRP